MKICCNEISEHEETSKMLPTDSPTFEKEIREVLNLQKMQAKVEVKRLGVCQID